MNAKAIVVVLLFAVCTGHAQPEISTGRMEIRADVDSALVVLNDSLVGRTPFVADSLSPGAYRVRVLHPDITSWLAAVVSDTVRITAGESRTLLYSLRSRLQVLSSPGEARVYMNDTLAGLTPLLISPERLSGDSLLTLRKTGFADLRTDLREAVQGILRVRLIPSGSTSTTEISPFLVETGGLGSRTNRLYLSAGATIVSGIFAAYFKTLADDRQAQYVKTGYVSLLVQRHRFDTSAAIALVTAQAAFVLFCSILLGD
jgi:hypothetical protein